MFASLFGAPKLTKNTLIIDIGSASVGAGLVRISRRDTPTLLLSHRAPIMLREALSGSELARGTIAALRETLTLISRRAVLYTESGRVEPQRIDDIVCICASPWYLPKTKLLRINRDSSFSLSRSLIGKLLGDEAALTHSESLGASVGKEELELIERLILSVRLNGYDTKNVFAEDIKSAELGLFASFMPGTFGASVRRELERVFTARPVVFHSFPLMFYLAMRALAPDLSRTLLVDVAGEVTDVILVEDGMIRGIASFPHGKRSIRRSLPVRSEEEGETILRLRAHQAESPVAERHGRAVDEGLSLWSRHFGEAVGKLLDGATLPRAAYLIADDSVLPLYAKAVEAEPLSNMLATGGRSVTSMTPALLRDYCRLGSAVGAGDPFLMIEGMVADSFFDRDLSFDFLSTNLALQE